MEHKTYSIEKLIEYGVNCKLLLPNFQREFVWQRKNHQRELLASLVYKMPIGSLLIVEGKIGSFATKRLCTTSNDNADENSTSHEAPLYLLDGQQRISTIKSIMYDLFSPANNNYHYNNIYELLKTRWFIRIKPDETVDLFGYENMKFCGQNTIDNFEPSDIVDAIEYKKVYPKARNWWDVMYKSEQWVTEGQEIKRDRRNGLIAEVAAEEGLIPLYEIFTFDEGNKAIKLHNKVIDAVADKRKKELQEDINDNVIRPELLIPDFNSDNYRCINKSLDELKDNWKTNVKDYIENLKRIEIPVMLLEVGEINRVIYAFEYINRGGMKLSVFDLVVAKSAHDMGKKTLTDRIKELVEDQEEELPNDLPTHHNSVDGSTWNSNYLKIVESGQIDEKFKYQYLNMLSIFSNIGFNDSASKLENLQVVHIKKEKHLNLTTEQINENTKRTVEALVKAYIFCQFRCGIIKLDDLKYQLLILPIAYALDKEEFWKDRKALDKIEYWYWVSLFSGAYRSKQNEQCIRDLKKLNDWLSGGNNPFCDRKEKVLDAEDYSDLNTLLLKNEEKLKSVPTAIQEGLLQYILSRRPKDFSDDNFKFSSWELAAGKTIKRGGKSSLLDLQKHHIIPLGSSDEEVKEGTKRIRADKDHILNSPLNLTLISSDANRDIGSTNLQSYLEKLSLLAAHQHFVPNADYENINMTEADQENFLQKRYECIREHLLEELEDLIG